MITDNQRPGVYSRYDTAPAYPTARSPSCAAVVARAVGGETGVLREITAAAQLHEMFPPDEGDACLRGCVQILLQSGVSKVYAVAVEEDFYEDALALIGEAPDIGAVVCDCTDVADRKALRASILHCAEAQRERIAFCGADPETAAAEAAGLNCERLVLCTPAVCGVGGGHRSAAYGAAALAGKALALGDPVWNFSGEPLTTVLSPAPLAESRVQELLAAGVTVLEENGGAVECIRALTTRTKTDGEPDLSLRGLNAVLCIDDVMRDIRVALKAALRGARLPGQPYQAIRSQVAVVLGRKQDGGIVERFDAPAVYAHGDDPSVCVVELSFHIAHVVHQIHVTAHVQV